MHLSPLGDPTLLDPARIVPVEGGRVLPGEQERLIAKRGRKSPVTEKEALGVMRRRRRAELAPQYKQLSKRKLAEAGLPATLEEALPSQLPDWTVAKKAVTMRLSPRLRALVDAHAELEGSNFSAVVEEALWKLINSPPRDPATARAALLEFHKQTVGMDRLNEQFSP